MPKVRKHISKRTTVRKRASVQKKVTEHHRKIRKEARKLSKAGVKKPLKKIPSIPNLYPFKNDLLDSMERKEQYDQEMKEHLKSLRNAQKNLPQGTLENYAAQVNAKVQQFEDDQGQLTSKEIDEAQRLME